MSCITAFAKYILFIFNFLISVCAIILIVFGIIFFMQENATVNVFSNFGSFFSFGILAIVVGVIILFIAGFGCCGAIHQNTCLLTTYGVILIILFALQLAVGILAVIKIIGEDDFKDIVRDLLQELFDEKNTTSLSTFYKIQSEFECCGINNYTDYNEPSSGYPSSCCGYTPCYIPHWTTGCGEALGNFILQYIEIIGYVAIGFGVIELVGAIFSFLARRELLLSALTFPKIKNEEDKKEKEEKTETCA